jgi:flagellar L-ring protein FlgH
MNPMRSLCAVLIAVTAALPVAAQSLYHEKSYQSLTADRRAHRVGDTLTVLVYENSSATESANSSSGKTTGVDLGLTNKSGSHAFKLSAGGDFSGKGQIQRSGQLAAQITVTVQHILPNGDLGITGKQEITVNGEKQVLQVSGNVRPIDVSDSNTVLSTRIADAKIDYVGEGILAGQHKGVLTRFLSWLGLI